jgi:hypothetical protein
MNMQAAPVLAPPLPKTLADTGLPLVMLRDILLKSMFRRNLERASEISEHALPAAGPDAGADRRRAFEPAGRGHRHAARHLQQRDGLPADR